jgi:dipeptidyl aminopeptidase/acylaminoacyl peptidase
MAWRPDGKVLALVTRRHPLTPQASPQGHSIVTLAADGGALRELASVESDSSLAWSPDGRYIAFVDAPESDYSNSGAESTLADFNKEPSVGHIAMIRPDGTGRVVGLAPADALSPLSWSADGSQLAYQRLGTCIVASLSGGGIR